MLPGCFGLLDHFEIGSGSPGARIIRSKLRAKYLQSPLRVLERPVLVPFGLENLADVVGDDGHIGMVGAIHLLYDLQGPLGVLRIPVI